MAAPTDSSSSTIDINRSRGTPLSNFDFRPTAWLKSAKGNKRRLSQVADGPVAAPKVTACEIHSMILGLPIQSGCCATVRLAAGDRSPKATFAGPDPTLVWPIPHEG